MINYKKMILNVLFISLVCLSIAHAVPSNIERCLDGLQKMFGHNSALGSVKHAILYLSYFDEDYESNPDASRYYLSFFKYLHAGKILLPDAFCLQRVLGKTHIDELKASSSEDNADVYKKCVDGLSLFESTSENKYKEFIDKREIILSNALYKCKQGTGNPKLPLVYEFGSHGYDYLTHISVAVEFKLGEQLYDPQTYCLKNYTNS